MTETNAVAERPAAQVPALAYDPAQEITSEDIALPRLKLGQKSSRSDVPLGSIFVELGPDDPEPEVVSEGDTPVRFYVIGFFKGKSLSDGGELQTWRYDDPSVPEGAWTTYNYILVIPEVEQEVPIKFLLTRTGTQAAKQLNLMLQKAARKGPAHEAPFHLTTKTKTNDKGTFAVAQIARADAPARTVKADLKVVSELHEIVNAGKTDAGPDATGPAAGADAPGID